MLFMWLPIALAAQQYRFEEISIAGAGCRTIVQGLNNRGALVGRYYKAGPYGWQGFKRDANGVFEFPIRTETGYNFMANGINDFGEIVGTYDGLHGFVLTGGLKGTYTTVDLQHGGQTQVNGVNDSGDIAGLVSGLQTGTHAFAIISGVTTLFDVPRAISTLATDIAKDGTVIGIYTSTRDLEAGFLRGPKGKVLGFKVQDSYRTDPWGISNAAGVIVGSYQDRQYRYHGFVYDYVSDLATSEQAGAGFRTVTVTTVDYSPTQDTYLTGVNADGIVTGYSSAPQNCWKSFVGIPQ